MGWKLLAWGALVLATVPALARESPVSGETILIRFRHPYAICAGVCPQYQLEIQPTGEVKRSTAYPSNHDEVLSNPTIHFRVLTAMLRQFQDELDAFRPSGDLPLDTACVQAKREDGSIDPLSEAKPDDIEVRWINRRKTVRLTSCAGNSLRGRLQSALRNLGIDPYSGAPLH
jgi:hypothetical protein